MNKILEDLRGMNWTLIIPSYKEECLEGKLILSVEICNSSSWQNKYNMAFTLNQIFELHSLLYTKCIARISSVLDMFLLRTINIKFCF